MHYHHAEREVVKASSYYWGNGELCRVQTVQLIYNGNRVSAVISIGNVEEFSLWMFLFTACK